MGKERERYFVMAMPAYFIALWFGLVMAVFYPDVDTSEVNGLVTSCLCVQALSKPTIGLIMLVAMIFVIFIGFPISFTLIFLAFVFGIWGSNFKLTTLLMTLNTNSTMLNDQLMAVPLFHPDGYRHGGRRVLWSVCSASIQMIMSRVRGALYIAVLIVCHNLCGGHGHRRSLCYFAGYYGRARR